MSNLDWLLLIGFAVVATIVVLGIFAIVGIIRWWIRSMDEPVDKSAPRVRTRIRQSPDWNGTA